MWAAIATEPSNVATVARKASTGSAPFASRREIERGDHLGIGGDLGGEPERLERLQVGVVVDIAVQRSRDVLPAVDTELLVVQRVRVRLGDDPDARPAGVREHDRGRSVRPQCEPQQLVVRDLLTQARSVVAELSDLGGGLVHEGQMSVGDADRARREQRIGAAQLHEARDRRVVEVEIVTRNEHVQSRGVATADLEPVERRQGDRDRVERVDRAAVGTTTRQRLDDARGAEAIVAHGPHRVLGCDQRRIERLDLQPIRRVEIEPGLELGQRSGQ